MGKVAKGVKCSVSGCNSEAIRSLPTEKVVAAGLKVSSSRRTYLCREHYKQYKRETKKEKKVEKWRYKP